MVKPDIFFLRKAVKLAEEAGHIGNLPIGALIVLDGRVIARGRNAIWQPVTDLTRHAEMEALRAIPIQLRDRCQEMALYTTLEPCLMCAGAILLHQVGRLVFGACDPFGGVGASLESLAPYFSQALARMEWVGPALAGECDPLFLRIQALEQRRDLTAGSAFSEE